MTENIGWELYRTFLSVLHEGSLSAAARKLGVTQPTAGRHIDVLEKSLSLTLFIRSQEGLQPTEAALALQTLAEEMSSTAAALKRAASAQGEGVRGVVRVTASEIIGVEVLPSILAGICDEHSDLKLELTLSNQPQDLLHREADIAIRMFKPQQTQLLAQKVGEVKLGAFAHVDYVTRRGRPQSPADLANHILIGFDQSSAYIRSALKQVPQFYTRNRFSLAADNDLAQLALIRNGAGIGICQVPLAHRDGKLIRLLRSDIDIGMDIWVTMHEDLRHSSAYRVVFDILVDGLRQYKALKVDKVD